METGPPKTEGSSPELFSSDLLDPNDVDSLVRVFSPQDPAPESTPPALSYDFRRPNRISKDQLRTLLSIHDGFARLFSTSLSSILRSFIEIQVESIDQVTYAEVTQSLANPTSIFIFDVEPVERKAFIEIQLGLVSSIIDRLFGGRGQNLDRNRELTAIEERVLSTIVERALADLVTTWRPFFEIEPRLDSVESNPRFVQVSFQNDVVLYITFKVIMEEGYGYLSMCFPYLLIEPMLAQLSNTSWLVSKLGGQSDEDQDLLRRELEETRLNLHALVGTTELPLSEIVELEVGDVIRLDESADRPIKVDVGGITKFWGHPGRSGTRKAIKVEQVAEEPETDPSAPSPNGPELGPDPGLVPDPEE